MKKKLITTCIILVIISLLCVNFVSAASNGQATYIETRKVKLSAKTGKAEIVENKDFNFYVSEDNGILIYNFDYVDQEYRKAAMEYIHKETGDTQTQTTCYGPYFINQIYYINDTDYDGNDASAYTWTKYKHLGCDSGYFWGGQSACWFGSTDATQIILNQRATFSGIFMTISWPPSYTGSSTSRTWESYPIYSNNAGASRPTINSYKAYMAVFIDGGDIYVNSYVYRPSTYLKYV